MEILLLLAILVFVIVILNKQTKAISNHQNELSKLEKKIDEINAKLTYQPEFSKEHEKEVYNSEIKIVTDDALLKSQMEHELTAHPVIIAEEQTKDGPTEIEEQEKAVVFSDSETVSKDSTITTEHKASPIPQIAIPKKSWLKNFKEKNPDIEKFIGENLINKIGILILVLGISFFVKFAIDKDWINEPARVGIGILCGSIVMAIAHRLRKNYPAFSSVFVAGAVSIFYLTIGIAFHDYKLFSQSVAFIIMVVITVFSAFVSISYNRKELAVLSLIGGFAVPFMVSTGEGNYIVLFTYIAVLNVGMLIIAYFKKWNLVTLLAFLFTCILYSAWFGKEFSSQKFSHGGALFFASIFYFVFSIATVINNIKSKGRFTKLEYFIMLSNTFFYFGMGAAIIENWKPELKGLFTIALALYNLIYAVVLYKKFGINKDAVYFLLGLTLTFVTITIPFQFNGNYITLFWGCEAVLLLWLSQKSKIVPFKLGAIVVHALMLISLLMDWNQSYGGYSNDIVLYPFLNKIFVTGLVATASFVCAYYLLKKEDVPTKFYFLNIDPKIYRTTALISAICIGYFVGLLEINYQAFAYLDNQSSALSYPVLYHFIFSAVVAYLLLRYKSPGKIFIAIGLSAINIIVFLFRYCQLPIEEMVSNANENNLYKSALIIHYAVFSCVVFFIFTLIKHRKETVLTNLLNNKVAFWIFAFCTVYILSNELMIHGLLLSGNIVNQYELVKKFPVIPGNTDSILEKQLFILDQFAVLKKQIIKIGYPILWGTLSFVFLIFGIKKQNKQLRIIALSLLGITILKLFIYDIKNVSETGKIIAFILLGVLVLIISFVYQKIKKLVMNEPNNQKDEEII